MGAIDQIVERAVQVRDLSVRSAPARYPLWLLYGDQAEGYPYAVARDVVYWEPNMRLALFAVSSERAQQVVQFAYVWGYMDAASCLIYAERRRYLKADDLVEARRVLEQRSDSGPGLAARARAHRHLFRTGPGPIATSYGASSGQPDDENGTEGDL